MKWECIGSGSSFNFDLGNTSFLVEDKLLVDCGDDVPPKLIRQNKVQLVKHIVLTHLHHDHCGGLETLAFWLRYVAKSRYFDLPTIYLPDGDFRDSLWSKLRDGMDSEDGPDGVPITKYLEDYFHVSVGQTFKIDGLPPINFVPTTHRGNMKCYSLAFGRQVFYSGDTNVFPPAGEFKHVLQDCQ